MLNNKPSFKHWQSKWYWERILTVTNDFSGICRRNLKRSKNQTMSLQLLQGLSQSTMQLCQIFHTWRYVLQVDGILWSLCCNMSSTAFHTIHSRNAATNKLQVPSQRKNWRWYLYKHLPINKCTNIIQFMSLSSQKTWCYWSISGRSVFGYLHTCQPTPRVLKLPEYCWDATSKTNGFTNTATFSWILTLETNDIYLFWRLE